jgi:hypothetical protein
MWHDPYLAKTAFKRRLKYHTYPRKSPTANKVESAREKLFMDNYFVLNQQQLSDLHDREVIKQLQHCSSADRR